jgi:hyperosmotically inducible protein
LSSLAVVLLAAPGLLLGYGSGASGEASTQPATQQQVDERVGHELASLAYYGVFDELSFRVEAGKIILSGQVTQPVVKADAERAIRRIAGNQTVVNEIEVLPLSRVDDQIRRNTFYAVYGYGPLERYGFGAQPAIRIIVKNGRVTLIGMVANEMDRSIVYQRASMVPGVSSVTNHLLIET